ncbi:MAG: hypothetical protein IT363_12865 [Methanoregulaceae archaeon]|nr:hypothetical protein [Methanoregulaceae archaeon]
MIPIEEQVKVFSQRLAPILRSHEMEHVPHETRVEFVGPHHQITISFDWRDQLFECYLQVTKSYRLDAVLTSSERIDMEEEMRTLGTNFFRRADVLSKYVRVAWDRMGGPGWKSMSLLRSAVHELEPTIGPLPRTRHVIDALIAGATPSRELLDEAHDEALSHFLRNLDAESEPTELGKEIDSRLMAPLEQLMLLEE